MNSHQIRHTSSRSPASARPQPSRPPIEWPKRPATELDQQRERAAQLARQHVEQAHQQTTPEPQATPNQQTHTMSNQPYDWQTYHSAWQQYYHQYFYRYYAGWWQQHRKQLEQTQAENQPAQPSDEHQELTNKIKSTIRHNVKKAADKAKSSTHFKPMLAAIAVGVCFLFLNYNQIVVGAIKQYIAPGSVVTTPVIVEPNTRNMVGKNPKIIIPKIGVDAPVVYDEPKVDEASYQKALERGVVRLGTTANPGTKGNVVIGGHSSNNVFNAGKYKYVFVNLKQLDQGDIIYLNYNGLRYTYKVTVAKKIVAPKDTSALVQTAKPILTIFTCDPPGTNVNRLIVQAEQIDPSPAGATDNKNKDTVFDQKNPLPSVAPSIWDRLLSIF